MENNEWCLVEPNDFVHDFSYSNEKGEPCIEDRVLFCLMSTNLSGDFLKNKL